VPASPHLLEYGNDHVERKLRSAIQNHRQVGYLFLGSRKHLIQKMVLDRNRPLYRAGGHYVSRHGLSSASNVQRAVQALLAKDIIDRDNGSFLITDRFFRLWIQSVQSV